MRALPLFLGQEMGGPGALPKDEYDTIDMVDILRELTMTDALMMSGMGYSSNSDGDGGGEIN